VENRRASPKRVFDAHALVHHRHYAEIFSDARGEDREIRLTARKAQIKAMRLLRSLLSYPGRGRRFCGRYDFPSLGVDQNSSGDAQAAAEGLQHLASL
jgi:hypothetical protein